MPPLTANLHASTRLSKRVRIPTRGPARRRTSPPPEAQALNRVLTAAGNAFSVLSDRERALLLQESDAGVLATLAQVVSSKVDADPLADARARAAEERAKLIAAAGAFLDTKTVADRLHITPQAIHKQFKQGKLLAVLRGNVLGFPACQFDDEGAPAPGLPEVLRLLKRRSFGPWTQLRFLAGGNTRLRNQTPLEALRAGHLDEVRRAAEAFEEHGAD
jgi:hypothetical protein